MNTSPPFADLSAFKSCIDELVPDSRGDFDEDKFVEQALARLADDHPAVEAVDVGDGTVRAWVLPGDTGDPFERWAPGFSDRFPLDVELLTTGDVAIEPPSDYPSEFRIETRWVSGALAFYLVVGSAPAANAKARVRFRRPYIVRDAVEDPAADAVVEVPRHFQMAVVFWACALKCDSLASFYRSSIDPNGGSDIFDARQFAKDYVDQAEKFRERYAELSGVGDDEVSFSHGQIDDNVLTVFPRGHYDGTRDNA